MKLSAAVISTLAVAAIAAPAPASKSGKQLSPLARRARLDRQAQLQHKFKGKSAAATNNKASTESSDVEYNENWAGVVSETTAGSVTGVYADFVLPTIKKPTDGDQVDATVHTASQWIGIDGYSCGTGLWQAGVDGNLASDGSISWYAWYEWYPANTVVVDLGDLAAGQVSFL